MKTSRLMARTRAAFTHARRRRRGTCWLVATLAVGTAVVTASGGAAPALAYLESGHWLFDAGQQAVLHIDGGTKGVNARINGVAAAPNSQVLQGSNQVFIVGGRRVTVFGKSSLRVQGSAPTGIDEPPVGIETVGGPYLVYPQHGQIVRLGSSRVVITAGGRLASPVSTTDGTLWVRRGDDVCRLGRSDTALRCPVHTPAGHRGALTTIADRPAFVDTTAGTVRVMAGDDLGAPRPLGVRVSAGALVAPTDVHGRVPILSGTSLVLVDTHDRPTEPVTVAVGAGRDATISTSGGSVAVLDPGHHRLSTYDGSGRERGTTRVDPADGTPRLARGEDGRVYLDTPGGDNRYVVDGDGRVTPVPITGDAPTSPAAGTRPTPSTSPNPPAPDKRNDRSSPAPSTPTPPTSAPEPVVGANPPATAPVRDGAPRTTRPPGDSAPRRSNPPATRPSTPRSTPPSTPPASTPPAPQPTAPGAPGSVVAAAGDAGADVTWQAAAGNGAAVTAYRVSWRPAAGSGATGSTASSGSSRHASVSGLTNGVPYVVSVAAVNRIGTGPAVDAAPVTPELAALAAPAGVQAAANADGTARVTWRAVDGHGHAIAHYTVTGHGPDGEFAAGTTGGTTVVVDNNILDWGRSYRFSVTATDDLGRTSPASGDTNPVTSYEPALAPRNLDANDGDGTLDVTWTAGDLRGGTLDHWQVTVPGRPDRDVSGTSVHLTGLDNGTSYRVTVRAVTHEPGNPGSPAAVGESASVTGTPSGPAPTPAPTPTIVVSKGAPTTWDDQCTRPTCYFMHVEMTGFAPNTTYDVVPHADSDGYANGGATLTTDAQGRLTTQRFAYGVVGQHVWVTAGGVTSNRFTW